MSLQQPDILTKAEVILEGRLYRQAGFDCAVEL